MTKPQPLPCWYDNYVALKEVARKGKISFDEEYQMADAEVYMSLVIPAYNEQDRMSQMLMEAVDYLQEHYGHHGTQGRNVSNGSLRATGGQEDLRRGWEIVLVNDGSNDKTVQVALDFARKNLLRKASLNGKSQGNGASRSATIEPGTIRVVSLEQNRGKGGAVTHGMRHVRGTYVVFADADGASKFSDLGKLVSECEKVKDKQGRAVGVGSRAHMVDTEAVVKVRPIYRFAILPMPMPMSIPVLSRPRTRCTRLRMELHADMFPSDPSFATCSCVHSTLVSGFSRHLALLRSRTPNAASNSSRDLRYHT